MTTAYNKFLIDGTWVEPQDRSTLNVINPATEEAFATISLGTAEDVDAAVKPLRQLSALGLLPILRKGKPLLAK